MFACERAMFGGLHSDVTSFWSFEKSIRSSHQNTNHFAPKDDEILLRW